MLCPGKIRRVYGPGGGGGGWGCRQAGEDEYPCSLDVSHGASLGGLRDKPIIFYHHRREKTPNTGFMLGYRLPTGQTVG